MIQFCTCNKRFISPLEIPEGQESSKSCRSCGGILSVDELGLSRRMWSTVGPEFSGVIDPQLKWKTSSNGKHRALRKARTFTQDNGKKFTANKNTEDIEDLFNESSKKEGHMLVSESEKFGVSVLGRRFSESLESVPIKKRRFSLLSRQSTPHILSSSGFYDHNHGGRLALLQNSQGSLKQDESGMYSSHGVDWGQEKSSADEKRCLEDIDEHTGDSADFSGISILAAAACYSSIEKGFMDAKDPTVKEHSFEENSSSLRFSESLEHKDWPSKLKLGNKPKPSVASLTAVEAFGRELGQLKFDECKEENSVGSLQNFSNKRKSASLRDDRLHWDLNTVMDVWESQSDDFSNSDSLDNCVNRNGSHVMEFGNQGLGQDKVVVGNNKVELIAAGNQDIPHCFEEIDRKHANPVVDCGEGKHGLAKTQVCETLQKECQFMNAKVMLANAPEKTSPTGGSEKSCVVARNAQPIEDFAQLDRDLSAKLVAVFDEEKNETDNVNFSVEVDTHSTLPCLVNTGNVTLGRIMNACDPFSEDKNVNEMLHDGSISIATVDSCNDHSGECHPANIVKGNQLRSPRAEKHHTVSADVALSITAQKSPAGQLDQKTFGIIIQGGEKTFQAPPDGSSSKSLTTYGCLADETPYIDEFGKADANVNQSTVHFNSIGTSDNEQLPSRNAYINQYKEISADWKVDDCRSRILCGESLTASTVVPFHTSKLTNSISEGLILENNDIPLADDISTSHEECRTPADGHVWRSFKDSLEEHLDSEHSSDAACPIDTDHATGSEKVEFPEDDDSQYEDGELRETVLNSWEEGVEEVETECVDYGSDCREADFFESESDFCSQSDLAVGTTECKDEEKLVSIFSDGIITRVTEDDSPSKCFQKHFLIKDASNVHSGEGVVRKNLDTSVTNELSARDENRLLTSNVSTDVNDVPGKSGQPDSSRMKSSGWDKLPRREDASVDALCNHVGASATTSGNGEYARTVVASVKRDSSSRVERSKSFEASCRKEVSYTTENKKVDHFDFNAERSTNASRSIGRSRLPFRSYGRGRVDCWGGSPDHRGSCGFDTSGYHSSPNFALPGSRNAAAAAVAKAESNGYVVAPDGTIVKAGSHLSGRCSNSSTHLQSTRRGSTMEIDGAFDMSSEPSNSTREASPDRCFNVGRGRASRHGSRFISLGHRNMYHAPMLDRRIDSLSLQHPSSRRQRSFSPQRRPIHLSREHTSSPSRSKTRSPHNWTSPRGRDPGVRRQSRSLTNFKTQRRMPRQRSPQRRVMPAEELPVYASSSRSHFSPPLHASRWFDNERVLHGHNLQEHQPRCPTGRRSSPARIFSQSNRLDHIDSRGKLKPDEYYQPIYSGRFHEYAGYGRGSKHGSRDNGRRGRSSRYELLHPQGRLESNVDVKCLGYGENGNRTHDLERRESPRTFDRSIDVQYKDSPRRIKGEMFHFRRGRDGKLNPDFKSFGVRDTTDDMSLQRRPS